ncbi:hypothetical protein H8R23_04965 [Flavobacterium sp. F-380]|uniref:Uncharacterized protein n=1 Tax=Flavobacterium kayseriense TaxID=2764714 RepID=A0ABR7J5M6_9FLAO|nr:hypothetical protein [Flavobacterium kayseriense]MBC5840748.1 hypothetical protein [Flavobacterium kayseriense]MBC5846582.1 hypothetical protein [Flavobacterium kayseriense]
MGLLLIIITWILTPVLEIGNFLTTIVLSVTKFQFWKTVNGYFKSGAIDRDRFGNHNYRSGLNFWFSTGGYEFGNNKETMSSVFGKKALEDSLNKWGWFWYYLLYAIDYSNWKKGGHCFASINNNI